MARMHTVVARLAERDAVRDAERYRAELVELAKELELLGVFDDTGKKSDVERSISSKISKYSVWHASSSKEMTSVPYTIRRRPRG